MWKSTNLAVICEILVLICMLPTDCAHPVVRPCTPGNPTVFDIPFLESKSGQTIWPSPSKSPWPCLLPKQFNFSLFKVLATQCDWGQQFDQLPLWREEPLALSLYLKVNQFDCTLWDTGTHMYVTYWLDPTSLQCPSSCDTIHTRKSNYCDILFLESKTDQTIWPSTSKSPWPCPTCWKSNNLT